jgi:hypothetical protein
MSLLTDKKPRFTYSSPSALDVTTLKNYVAPENTMEAENKNWASSKSKFYEFDEYHIFARACVRREPGEVELSNAVTRLTDEQHDALVSLEMTDSCGIDIDKEDMDIVEAMNIAAFYRYRSITHSKHRPGMAVVIDNELIIAF